MHTNVEGAGIGLYMVKRMVENNGGRILVESQPEVGTTFKVYLPVSLEFTKRDENSLAL